MTDKVAEMIRPEIPVEHDAVGTLLALASSFLPGMDLSRLPALRERTGSETKAGISFARARYQMLIEMDVGPNVASASAFITAIDPNQKHGGYPGSALSSGSDSRGLRVQSRSCDPWRAKTRPRVACRSPRN
jgi:hypothetical protein